MDFKLKAGETFAKGGSVPGLSSAIPWGFACSVRDRETEALVADLTTTIFRQPDFATTGRHAITFSQTADQTLDWGPAVGRDKRVLLIDFKFFNTTNPDPVLYSETRLIEVTRAVTP